MNAPHDIPQTEENIPLLAHLAVQEAYREALEAGQSVLTVKDNLLLEVFPDGRIREVKTVEPSTASEPGQSARLQ